MVFSPRRAKKPYTISGHYLGTPYAPLPPQSARHRNPAADHGAAVLRSRLPADRGCHRSARVAPERAHGRRYFVAFGAAVPAVFGDVARDEPAHAARRPADSATGSAAGRPGLAADGAIGAEPGRADPRGVYRH